VSAAAEHALAWARGLAWASILLSVGACSVGQGEGSMYSENLFVDNCWDGEFDLRPTFFGANPFADTLTIRVQRGEQDILVSDGFTMLVYNTSAVRELPPNTDLPLGLPEGVTPVGFPLPEVPRRPAASLSLYLNNSCRAQNSQLYAVSGNVRFTRLFSGDLNEENSEDRITDGTFEAIVADTRFAIPTEDAEGNPTYSFPEERTSTVAGDFNFVFHRGTPAQPFP
jgi:hypothetical protein